MIRQIIICWLLLGCIAPVWAANEAGKVLFVAGSVTAERAETVVLQKTDLIFENDVIVTAAKSRGQLLMRDGARFALRPETRFIVEEYFQAGDERTEPDGAVVVAADDSAVTELIKGGFRTITGAIGKDDPAAYEVKTPAATMGIRGTHYSVVWCAKDCEPPPGIGSRKTIRDGLYIGVTDGIVVIKNLTGEYQLTTGEYAYVRDRNSVPVRLPDAPAALIDTFATDEFPSQQELASQEIRDTLAALGGDASTFGFPSPRPDQSAPKTGGVPPRPWENPNLVEPEYFPPVPPTTLQSVALSGGPIDGFQGGGVFSGSAHYGTRTFAGNDLTQFQSPPETGDTSYAMGTAGLRDDGFDPVTGIGWGRWSGGAATITPTGVAPISADLSAQSLHWVYGPVTAAPPAMPITGTANFTLIAGNTDPTDNLGNSGVLGNASLFANFTNATVQSELSLAINGSNWTASGSGTIGNSLFSGLYDSVFTAGRGGGSGNFSGFFGAPLANGLPNGAGLAYGLTDAMGQSVSGAVVFGAPSP